MSYKSLRLGACGMGMIENGNLLHLCSAIFSVEKDYASDTEEGTVYLL